MSTTIDENIEVVEPRNINILLSLETYQGMTDEEIDMVLQYKIDTAINSYEMNAKLEAFNTASKQTIEDNRASSQRALDMLQSIIDTEFPMIPKGTPQTFAAQTI